MSGPASFRIAVPQARLDAIRARVSAFDWDGFPDAGGWSAGMDKATLRRICDHWLHGYDWRAQEARLNALPQFHAEIEGIPVHFLHLRGSGPAGRPPLVLTHGWPSSFLEFVEAAQRLAWPERFWGRAADGFDVIVPSLPGYAFSGRPAHPIGPRAVARMWNTLITRTLGYPRYIAQGSDWGSIVSAWIAHDHAGPCFALHIKLATIQLASGTPQGPAEEEYLAFTRRMASEEAGYSAIQATRPQTLGFALADSPVGTAAWILEKFAAWSDLPRAAGTPDLEAVYTLDQLLTNVMLYLVTDSIVTSTWLYKGTVDEQSRLLERRVDVPTSVAAFADPVFPAPPRSLAERSFNIVRWADLRGGHFAAMEQPEIFVEDVRAFALGMVE